MRRTSLNTNQLLCRLYNDMTQSVFVQIICVHPALIAAIFGQNVSPAPPPAASQSLCTQSKVDKLTENTHWCDLKVNTVD